MELLAKVYDHAKHRYTRGFRMLTLGWSDGVTFLPVNSCLLSSENPNSRINDSNPVAPNSNGAKAREFATKKATEVIPQLISDAMDAGIHADYVLFDSWFSSPKVIRSMKEKGLDVVAMVKKSSKVHYRFQGERLDCKEIAPPGPFPVSSECRSRDRRSCGKPETHRSEAGFCTEPK